MRQQDIVTNWQPVHPSPVSAYSFAYWEAAPGRFMTLTPQSGLSFSDSSNSGDAGWVLPDQQLARILVDSFKEVPEVVSICAHFSADGITIWTLLREYDRNARGNVYQKELEICQRLGVYDFDFRVTAVDLVPPADLVRTGSVEIYRRQ